MLSEAYGLQKPPLPFCKKSSFSQLEEPASLEKGEGGGALWGRVRTCTWDRRAGGPGHLGSRGLLGIEDSRAVEVSGLWVCASDKGKLRASLVTCSLVSTDIGTGSRMLVKRRVLGA